MIELLVFLYLFAIILELHRVNPYDAVRNYYYLLENPFASVDPKGCPLIYLLVSFP